MGVRLLLSPALAAVALLLASTYGLHRPDVFPQRPRPDGEMVGEYALSDGPTFGATVQLGADYRFQIVDVQPSGPASVTYTVTAEGRWRRTGHIVVLETDYTAPGATHPPRRQLLPTWWGERRYLVPAPTPGSYVTDGFAGAGRGYGLRVGTLGR